MNTIEELVEALLEELDQHDCASVEEYREIAERLMGSREK